VAVTVRERPFVAVLADMIEGVIVVNRLVSPEADQVRTALWTMLNVMGVVASAQVVDDDVEVPRVA
jgi:hypothetical protein